MYEELVKRLRFKAGFESVYDSVYDEAADAIEELSHQRDRAYARLCEWCGVCPVDRRNLEDCEIAAIYPEPPKEEA